MNQDELIKVEGLKKYFGAVKAVDDISFSINKGEIFGLVGESGSGKSTIGKCIIRLENPTEGSIVFKGHEIGGNLDKENTKILRSGIQMIYQDPMASLNPRLTIGEIIGEGLDIRKLYTSRQERRTKIENMMLKVGLNPAYYDRYPAQFSGGQRQRAGIARVLLMEPELIIADECISALDVSVQAQVVNLLKELRQELNTAMLFIAHDLSMVKYISDRIGVLHLGHLVEIGTTEEIFKNPMHPYTRSLVATIPTTNPVIEKFKTKVTFDYHTSGLDYSKGKMECVEGTHYVLK